MKHLLKLAIPVAFSQLLVIFMQMVDVWFAGRLSAETVAGVSAGNAVFVIGLIFGIGLMAGLDYPISYAVGSGRQRDANSFLIQGLILATAIAVPATLIQFVLSYHFEWFGVSPIVARNAAPYLRYMCLSLWPTLAFIGLRQYLQALGIANPVLWTMIIANVFNAFGNWVLVWGNLGVESLGVRGSAIATLLSRIFSLLVLTGFALYVNRSRKLGLLHEKFRVDYDRIREIFHLGLPAATQMTLEVGVFATSTLIVGRFGATPLAAHQIVLQIASLTFMVPLGISSAAAVRVAQALGAEKRAEAVRTGWLAIALGAGFMAVSGATLYLGAAPILGSFTRDSWVLELGTRLLFLVALFQLADGVQVVATGALRGLGNTRASMLANLVGHWFIGLPVGLYCAFVMRWSTHGVWVGLTVGLIVVSAALLWVWRNLTQNATA